MGHRYPVLRFLCRVYIWMGFAALLVGLASPFGGLGAVMAFWLIPFSIGIIVVAQLLTVIMDIEENTRRSADCAERSSGFRRWTGSSSPERAE